MKRRNPDISVLVLFGLIAGILTGCSGSSSIGEEEYLIRVENSNLTVGDFNKAFEVAKSAHTHNEMQNPDAFKQAQLKLLNQLTEELILLERAKELDVRVSDSEVEAMIGEIKKDFPGSAFEQTLLEHAVSYHAWKKRLRIRLLMEKVIEEELRDRIIIEPKDIVAYYEAHYGFKTDLDKEPENINEVIVEQLRRQKAENAYRLWIKNLRNKYTIEINQELWKKIVDS